MASMYCWPSVSVKRGANLVIGHGYCSIWIVYCVRLTFCCKITWRMKLFTFWVFILYCIKVFFCMVIYSMFSFSLSLEKNYLLFCLPTHPMFAYLLSEKH